MSHIVSRTSKQQVHSNLDIARGLFDNFSYVEKFGRNPTVASGAQEVIWDQSDAVYTYIVSASTLYISSSNTNDDQTYEVQGLDANWNMQTVEVTLNGFNFVALSGTWRRVFRAKNISGTNSAGDVYISDDNTDVGADGIPDDATNIKAKVLAGNNQTNMAIYTIPFGFKGYLTGWYASLLRASGTTAVASDMDIFRRDNGSVFRSTHPAGIQNTGSGRHHYDFDYPLELPAKSDIEVRGQPTANADISAGFTILLIRD